IDDSLAPGASWTNITGNLFDLTHTPSLTGNAALDNTLYNETILKYLSSIQADWRFDTPTTPPLLYVAGEDAVFRSTDMGATWSICAGIAHQGAPVNGGYLPNSHVSALSLALGNIDPRTGLPGDISTGFNLLLATTYGHGSYAIRLDSALHSLPNPP